MDVADIQQAIEALPQEQQATLLDWLADRESREWDNQIERDFSPGGLGMELLNRVKSQIQQGKSAPMNEPRRE